MSFLRPLPSFASPTRLAAGLSAALVVASAPVVAAASEAERDLGLRLADEGRCGPALEVLERVRAASPDDAEVATREGLCAIRLQDFTRAIASLEVAREIDPLTPQVDLFLGMAYYHAGRIDEAADALERAGATDGDRGEFLLYSGLVAYAQTDYVAAAGRLDAASQLSDAPVEPMATFFLGRAQLGAQDQGRARAAFEKVVRDHPGTPWATEAARILEEMESGGGIPWWVTAEIGLEADDNALLRGRGVGLPGEVSGQSDLRGFWFFDAGASFVEFEEVTGGATFRFAGSEHRDLEQFDTLAPGATFWLDRAIPATDAAIRLQYDFDAPFIDGPRDGNRDPFVISHLVGASIYKPWKGGQHTVFATSVGVDDYGYERFDLPASARNEIDATDRDGVGVSASLRHHAPLATPIPGVEDGWLEGEYRYQRYWSEGSEYDQQRHQIEVGVGAMLPFELQLRVSGRYAYVPYGNPTVFPDPGTSLLDDDDREEHETGVRLSLSRAIGDHVLVTTRYSRTRNRSSADVFDYTRDLFGVSVRVGLGG
ncbi:MAG: tetratricopeptide repeat protein [Myxococcota bacterium]